jgi:hypothetical protein
MNLLRPDDNGLRKLGLPARRAGMVRSAPVQGLTLVHFSAQRERFLCDRGCTQGLFMGCM